MSCNYDEILREYKILYTYERDNVLKKTQSVIDTSHVPHHCSECIFRLLDYHCILLNIDCSAPKCTVLDWTKYLMETV